MKINGNGLKFSIPVALGMLVTPQPTGEKVGHRPIIIEDTVQRIRDKSGKVIGLEGRLQEKYGELVITNTRPVTKPKNAHLTNTPVTIPIARIPLEPHEYGLKNVLLQEWGRARKNITHPHKCTQEEAMQEGLDDIFLLLRTSHPRVQEIIYHKMRYSPAEILRISHPLNDCINVYFNNTNDISVIEKIVNWLENYPYLQNEFSGTEKKYLLPGQEGETTIFMPTISDFYRGNITLHDYHEIYLYLINKYPEVRNMQPIKRPLSPQK